MKFYPLSPNVALYLWWNATDSREFPSLEESEWMVIGEIYWLDDPSLENIEDLLTVDDDNYEYEDENVRNRSYSGPHFPSFGMNIFSVFSSNAEE